MQKKKDIKNGESKMKVTKFRAHVSATIHKNPGKMVILGIITFNLIFLLVESLFIRSILSDLGKDDTFFSAVFYTLTMLVDPSNIGLIVSEAGLSDKVLVITCLFIIIVGMITFTGSLIGYMSNYITKFMSWENPAAKILLASGHIVILNWNTRASKIIHEAVFLNKKQDIVVFVSSERDAVEAEIKDIIMQTIRERNEKVVLDSKRLSSKVAQRAYIAKHKVRNKINVVVKKGETYVAKSLENVSIDKAKSVIILENEIVDKKDCKIEEKFIRSERVGNPEVVKTLVVVLDQLSKYDTAEKKNVIVEVKDDWTMKHVALVRSFKNSDKLNVVPIGIDALGGKLIMQFALTPELNIVYKEIFSNRGFTAKSKVVETSDKKAFAREMLEKYDDILPLNLTTVNGKNLAFYFEENKASQDVRESTNDEEITFAFKDVTSRVLNNILIIGHSNNTASVLSSYEEYMKQLGGNGQKVLFIDNEEYLKKKDYYSEYSHVSKTIALETLLTEKTQNEIREFISQENCKTTVLLLSDSTEMGDYVDSTVISRLISVSGILQHFSQFSSDIMKKVNVTVEIRNPEHYGVIKSYLPNCSVIVPAEYSGKIMLQMSSDAQLMELLSGVLSPNGSDATAEFYVVECNELFGQMPKKCTAKALIRSFFEESIRLGGAMPYSYAIIVGYVRDGEFFDFVGNQSSIEVELQPTDKIILYCA